jgi:transposase-like protein
MRNARCRVCGEIKSFDEFRNLRWTREETWICRDCEYNSEEAEEERRRRQEELNKPERIDLAPLGYEIERRMKQLAKVKQLITEWEERRGINLDGGINVECPTQDFHLITNGHTGIMREKGGT